MKRWMVLLIGVLIAPLGLLAQKPSDPKSSVPNYCLDFDGTKSYVQIPRSESLEPAEITIECWVKPSEDPQHFVSRIVRKVGHYQKGYMLSASQGQNNFLEGRFYGSGKDQTVSDFRITEERSDRWHHVAAVYAKTYCFLMIDGEVVDYKKHDEAVLLHDPPVDLILGTGPIMDQEFYAGRLDELRIWGYSRSVEQIRKEMWFKLKGDEEGLAAYYKFDEGQGSKLFDHSPNHNDGEIHSATWVKSEAPVFPEPEEMPTNSFESDLRMVPGSGSAENP
ncbi:LamG domain-containing protein [bacterium]|nr:LamG domain-containing protein [bacterium]